MQALNHVVFGGIVATIMPETVAPFAAFGSHFVLDAIPHYGNDELAPRGSKPYLMRIVLDALFSCLALVGLLYLEPRKAGSILICSFLSVLPDLAWPLALFVKRSGPLWEFFKFHKHIQRESRAGIYQELIYFMIFSLTFVYIARYT